jgi:hypothetical protein
VPDREVTIDPDVGIEFDLCIGDSAAQTDAELCAAVLARLRPMSSQNLAAAVSDAKEVYGGCRKGTSCGCSCAFSSPHLTSFVVADPGIEIAGEVTADALDAGVEALVGDATVIPFAPIPAPAGGTPAPTPAAASAGGGGLIDDLPLIPVAAACGGVLLLAIAVLVRRRGSKREQVMASTGVAFGAGLAATNTMNPTSDRKFTHDNPHFDKGNVQPNVL